MSVTLDLPEETQHRLQEKAEEKGLTMKSYLEELVRKDIESIGKNGTQTHSGASKAEAGSTEQWIAEFDAWASSHKPLPMEADDSRESIYAGRGE